MGDPRITIWQRICFWLSEDSNYRPFAIIGFLVLLIALLSGCSTLVQPFVKGPSNFACVFVNWTEEAHIQNYCAPGAQACATTAQMPNTIWTPKPKAFDDERRVLMLGHEFLHSLGATHR